MSSSLLGNYTFDKKSFEGVEEVIASFDSKGFLFLNEHQRSDVVNKHLIKLIKAHKDRGFLLFEVTDYIDRIKSKNILDRYNINSIELWMNQFSELRDEENYRIRALMMGRWIPRDDYQAFFPIGMGKVYEGSHFVTAHGSPDIDTIVSSFWGWVDAFSAKVSKNLHIWNVPLGPPQSSVEVQLLFYDTIHPNFFHHFSKKRTQLAVRSFDLMTQTGFAKRRPFENSLSLDGERTLNAVVLVDEDGYYKGDWRPFDVESIRQVIMSLNHCLKWFESQIHIMLFSLFSQKEISRDDVSHFLDKVASLSMTSCDALIEFTLRQQERLQKFLQSVLNVKSGIACTFKEFMQAAESSEVIDFDTFLRHLHDLKNSELFDQTGKIIENRPLIFYYLEKIVKELNDVFRGFRLYIDTLDIGYKIKTEVFGYLPQYLSHRTDVEEIQSKMGSYPYLTVNIPGPDDRQIPVGVIHANALKSVQLGTTTLRDFCNRDETKVPGYLEVISVIDHHKSQLNTKTAATVTIADAQAANVIIAQIAFTIHDEYSLSGMDRESIDSQVKELQARAKTPSDYRILRRLYKRLEILEKKSLYYVSETREYLEYLHYLVAILDDTDLLTKMTKKDVESVASLLNRMKTIMLKKEVETIHFDDVPRDENYVQTACQKLLQNPDLHSIYRGIYEKKEKVITENLIKCAKNEPSNLFVDTKLQNGCCRVGQTKIFVSNYKTFDENKIAVCDKWYEESLKLNELKPEFDLHIHMVSTVPSADELFKGEKKECLHKDQMWVWVPFSDLSVEHLKLYLTAMKKSPKMQEQKDNVELAFFGEHAKELSTIFKESFLRALHKFPDVKTKTSYAAIFYKVGSINSRKAMVTPYLPKPGL